ncbi:MAG: RstR family transcriptional regulator, partial [Gemmatimonadales bacterium]
KGAAEPSMSALKRLALALGVTIDELVFEDGERGPDEDLRLQFDADDKKIGKAPLDSLILKHQA